MHMHMHMHMHMPHSIYYNLIEKITGIRDANN